MSDDQDYIWGRVVRAVNKTLEDDAHLVRVFDVGLYDRDHALELVFLVFPDLRTGYQVQAAEGLPKSAFLAMEMGQGEVRERQL